MTNNQERSTKHTILIVDDEKSILKAMKRALANEDYNILMAENAIEALELFSNNKIALIISDFKMPGKSGSYLLEVVKKKDPLCIRIMLTGESNTPSIPEEIAKNILHCQEFITKPWDDGDLKLLIKNCLKKYNTDHQKITTE